MKSFIKNPIEKYQKLFESSKDGIIFTDIEGRIQDCNQAYLDMVGYTLEEIKKVSFQQLTPKKWHKMEEDIVKNQIFVQGYSNEYEKEYMDKDGTIFPINIRVWLIKDEQENPIGMWGIVRNITERKQVEEALRESEYVLKEVQAITHIGHWKLNPETLEVNGSDELFQIFGLNQDEANLDAFLEVVHPDDREYDALHIKRAIEYGESWDIEHRLVTRDGVEKWVHAIGEAIMDNTGKVISLLGTLQDITKRKETEQNLTLYTRKIEILNQIILEANKSENLPNLIKNIFEFTNKMFDFDGGGVYLADYDNNIANLVYTKDLPQDFTDSIKQCPLDIEPYKNLFYGKEPIFSENWHENDPVFAEKSGLLALAVIPILSKEKVIGALNIASKKNYTFSVEEKDMLQYVGREIGVAITKMQVEEELKKHRENLEHIVEQRTEALKESEEKYKQLFNSSPNTVVLLDLKGKVADCNIMFEKMFGFTREETIGKNFRDFGIIPKESEPIIMKTFMSLVKGKIPEPLEVLHGRKDGTLLWIYTQFALIKVKEKTLVQIIMKDITERKKAEESLRAMMEDLKRSNTELEQFAYVASHDLQEPLRMVASFTQLLQQRYQDKLDQDANEFINFAVDGAIRMQGLINDLLIFSRVGTRGKPFKASDMNVILQDVLNNVVQLIKETDATITNDPLPVVIADDSQMIQLLQNLISNAIKFHGDEPPRIHVSGEVKANEWIFSVKDNGIGIDSKYFEKIFVIFQRLHKKGVYGGTGIGLAVCKKIVQRHGGDIWIESELGKGSTFYFAIKKN